MTQCCGKQRATRFCPDCGTELREEGPLWQLLAHCRNVERAKMTEAQKRFDKIGRIHDQDAYLIESIRTEGEDVRAKSNQWKGWADALEALLLNTET